MNEQILVIGRNGQLSLSLQKALRSQNQSFYLDFNNFIFTSRDQIDLSNLDKIANFFQNKQFSMIINCAAYTSVDKAEDDFELAESINYLAVAQLAEIAKKKAIPLLHISTDYVFQGNVNKPYVETDKTDPINVYGLTKLKGEKAIINSGCFGAIFRTSWLYSEFGNNFVKTMLNLAKKNDYINVVSDQVGSPTYASNLANILLTILSNRKIIKILNSELNLYHFSDEGCCSWYDFAKAIFEIRKINCDINPIETKNYNLKSKRPMYSVMNKNKIKQLLPDLEIPHWRDSLVKCLAEI